MNMFVAALAWLALTVSWAAVPATASPPPIPPEAPGIIESLPYPPSPRWVWVTDLVLERIALVDLDSGRFLGMINSGYGPALALFAPQRDEVYLPATHFSRGYRGDRTDVLEVWNLRDLSFIAEIPIPPRRAIDSFALGHGALSDDDRFVAILNWTPATSLSIVDVEERRFAAEISISGCTLAYAAGPRRFFSLCGDGAALAVRVDDEGRAAGTERSRPFFDPARDPITEKAARFRDQWLFASFDGYLYTVDVSGPELTFPEPWSLLSDADRKASWRVGGLQHFAVHEPSGRLFALVHRGGPDGHKEPGEEVWVYDIERRERIQRIVLRHPGLTIYGEAIEPGRYRGWPWHNLFNWLLDTFVPALVTHIAVTRDDEPLLFTVSQFTGSVGVYDAASGAMLRRVQPIGWTSETLYAPFGGRD